MKALIQAKQRKEENISIAIKEQLETMIGTDITEEVVDGINVNVDVSFSSYEKEIEVDTSIDISNI